MSEANLTQRCWQADAFYAAHHGCVPRDATDCVLDFATMPSLTTRRSSRTLPQRQRAMQTKQLHIAGTDQTTPGTCARVGRERGRGACGHTSPSCTLAGQPQRWPGCTRRHTRWRRCPSPPAQPRWWGLIDPLHRPALRHVPAPRLHPGIAADCLTVVVDDV